MKNSLLKIYWFDLKKYLIRILTQHWIFNVSKDSNPSTLEILLKEKFPKIKYSTIKIKVAWSIFYAVYEQRIRKMNVTAREFIN